jgi:hypothetical protein
MTYPFRQAGTPQSGQAGSGVVKRGLALFCILLLLAPYAAADGRMFIRDRDMWYLQPEENQLAAIHYEDGMENMLLSVSPGSNFTGERAVWIFPVPAAPEKVSIDVLKGYPRWDGTDLDTEFRDSLSFSTATMALYATFPVSLTGGGAAVLSAFVFGMAGNIQKSADIQVYGRVEKMGVTSEVVAATDAGALRNFLLLRGMDDSMDGQQLLGDYIGKNYTFVVTSISDVAKFREASGHDGTYYDPYTGSAHQNPVGVFVRFPTDRIYFPLKPTAVYGTRQVPVLLYVTGYVSPELYEGIRDRTGITYFRQGYYSVSSDLAPFFNNKTPRHDLKYTKIRITTSADRFTDDLWMNPQPPAEVAAKDLYVQAGAAVSVVVYILFSMIASLLAGMLVFRKKAAGKKRLLLHGLWNCATFIGMAYATRKEFPQEEYGKRGPFILAFYVIFGLLLSAYVIALSPQLAPSVFIGWVIALLSPVLALGLLFIPVMVLTNLYHPDPFSVVQMLFVSGVAVVLALIPVPMLIWLKRWMDPAPVPVSLQNENNP